MKRKNRLGRMIWGILTTVMIFVLAYEPWNSRAEEFPDETEKLKIEAEVPVLNEDSPSPFDFHIDPQRLIYATSAMKFGGGTVEKDVAVLFQNKEGEYDFSSHSDKLTVRNKGGVPIKVIITGVVEQIGGTKLVAENHFEGRNNDLYLAIEDDRGNEVPLEETQAVQIEFVLDAFETYSFGLTGDCNTDWDWSGKEADISVKIQWKLEEIGDEKQGSEPDSEPEQHITESVSDNDYGAIREKLPVSVSVSDGDYESHRERLPGSVSSGNFDE